MSGTLMMVKNGRIVRKPVESVQIRHDDNSEQHFHDFRGEIVVRSPENPGIVIRKNAALTFAVFLAVYTTLMVAVGMWAMKLLILSHVR